ncbi:MAG: hypothetical protein IAE97_12905 [Chthoniobacterales bacterium]|nr:hypothetical protein [Chthoniobacterales bacterium]
MKTTKPHGEGRVVGVVLVGQLNGVRRIRWEAALLVACALGIFSGAIATGACFAISGSLSAAAAMIGILGPSITVGTGMRSALKLPVQELRPIGG